MPKKNKYPLYQTEFFEATFPGNLVGKEILDKSARRLGVVKSIKIEYLPWKIFLIVKGINLELPVDISEVENIGSVIQLKTKITAMPEINISDVIKIKKEIKDEIEEILLHSKF